eukprot:scaffold84862_cov76-Phaeocystis_antarctica.AAC.2
MERSHMMSSARGFRSLLKRDRCRDRDGICLMVPAKSSAASTTRPMRRCAALAHVSCSSTRMACAWRCSLTASLSRRCPPLRRTGRCR